MIQFVGFEGTFGLFRIDGRKMGRPRLLVVHEGAWTTPEAIALLSSREIPRRGFLEMMKPPKKCTCYADVQQYLGKGLKCVKAEFSEVLHATMFLYEPEDEYGVRDEYILAVPATGEGICFRIYRMDDRNALTLLVDMEL